MSCTVVPFETMRFCQWLKMLETLWEPFFEGLFSSFITFLMMSVASWQHCHFSGDFSHGNSKKSTEARSGEYGGVPLLSHCSLLRNPWPKLTSVLEHCHEGETNCWFPLFWTFLSDCILKTMKDVSIHFFIHSINSCKLYQQIPGTFCSYCVYL
jgi:hypothetical protein